jgi:hypothetical protein
MSTGVEAMSRYALKEVVIPNFSTDCLMLSSASYAVGECSLFFGFGRRLSRSGGSVEIDYGVMRRTVMPEYSDAAWRGLRRHGSNSSRELSRSRDGGKRLREIEVYIYPAANKDMRYQWPTQKDAHCDLSHSGFRVESEEW